MSANRSSGNGKGAGSRSRPRSQRASSAPKASPAQRKSTARGKAATAAKAPKSQRASTPSKTKPAASTAKSAADGLTSAAEALVARVLKQLDAVLLTPDRIQETLDEAAERGRLTRSDANVLVGELVNRGRQQTEDVLHEVEQLLGRGRDQIESATRRARRVEPVDRLVRGADRARRSVGVGPTFPILGYDDLTVGQVSERLSGLAPSELRRVRDYERRHANRKSVLEAIEKALD